MAEEDTKEIETPEASPPEEKQTTKEETTETAEKPDKTPEVESEEAQDTPEKTPEEETPKEEEAEKQVPVSVLQKERERRRQAEQAMFDSRQPKTPEEAPPELDPDAAKAVTAIAERVEANKYEQRRVDEFTKKHGESLEADPLLGNNVRGIIASENAQRRYIDPFDALEQAKELLDSRLKPQVDKAKEDSFKEGQEKAKEKAKAGAVGSSGPRPKVDKSKMTSEEFAKYHNIPRAN